MCAVLQTSQRSAGALTWAWVAVTDAADTHNIAAIAKIAANMRKARGVPGTERGICSEDSIIRAANAPEMNG
jgi:hypothetical protein